MEYSVPAKDLVKYNRFCKTDPEQPWPLKEFRNPYFLYEHRIARDNPDMASKKFKVDKKALAAVANVVLHQTPRLLPDRAPGKEASKSQPKEKEREKESSAKRKSVEVPPPPSPKRAKTVVMKEKPGRGEPKEKEVAAAVGRAGSAFGAFPARLMNPAATGPSMVLEGSGSSGVAGQEMVLVPTSWPKPQGPNGDCCITFRSFKGWFFGDDGGKGYPMECFKAFSLPQDLKHYEKRSLNSMSDELLTALGVVTFLGVQVVKMSKNLSGDTVNQKKKNDHLLERDARREGITKELSATLKKEGKINVGLKFLVKTLEDELDVIRQSTRIQEKENEDAWAHESQSAERAKADDAKVAAAEAAVEQEMAKMKVNPSVEVRKLVVEQYQDSDEFKTTLTQAAFLEWETGWNSCQRFLAEEGFAISEGLSSKYFWVKHPKGYPDKEETEGGGAAEGDVAAEGQGDQQICNRIGV